MPRILPTCQAAHVPLVRKTASPVICRLFIFPRCITRFAITGFGLFESLSQPSKQSSVTGACVFGRLRFTCGPSVGWACTFFPESACLPLSCVSHGKRRSRQCPIKANVKRNISSPARCRHFFCLGIQPNRLNVVPSSSLWFHFTVVTAPFVS